MHTLADCVKMLQGMTSSARNSQAAQDLQRNIEATKAHVQAQPNQFKDAATPSATPNMQRVPRVQTPNIQQVPRVQTPPSCIPGSVGIQKLPGCAGIHKLPGSVGIQKLPDHVGIQKLPGSVGIQKLPGSAGIQKLPRHWYTKNTRASHIEEDDDNNKRITCSMLAQPTVLRVHINVTPTNMPTNLAKQERIMKQRTARLRNAATPTSTSPRARTRAQVATAAARVAPPSMSTRS